jgi:hypothetical protein
VFEPLIPSKGISDPGIIMYQVYKDIAFIYLKLIN